MFKKHYIITYTYTYISININIFVKIIYHDNFNVRTFWNAINDDAVNDDFNATDDSFTNDDINKDINGDTNGDGNDRNTCVVCLTRPRNGKYQRILMCKIVSEKDATDDNSKYVLVYHVDDIIFDH